MSARLSRRLALAIGRLIGRILPRPQSSWSRAMLHEIGAVEDDWEALDFATGCLCAAVVQAVTFHAARLSILSRSGGFHSGAGGVTIMDALKNRLNNPRSLGLACAIGAAGLGLAYLTAAGAPLRYIVVNAASLLLGLVAFSGIGKSGWRAGRASGSLLLVLSVALLATALFGASVEGASRWIRVGPLGVQASLIVLPFMIVVFAQRRDWAATVAMVLAAAALALQPDRAMAGVLAAGLGAVAILARDRRLLTALLAAAAAFGATLLRPDRLPAAAYVDQILYSAFEVHALAGVAVVTGAFLLIVPAVAGRFSDPDNSGAYAAFGTVWLGIVVAAALGNYPTPLVGFGGSAVLGYLLSLAALPAAARSAARVRGRPAPDEQPAHDDGARMSLGAAYSS